MQGRYNAIKNAAFFAFFKHIAIFAYKSNYYKNKNMKTYRFLIVTSLFTTLSFTSCSTNEDMTINVGQNQTKTISPKEMGLMFDAWADSLYNTFPPSTKAPELKLTWYQKLKIAAADAKGAWRGKNLGLAFSMTGPGAIVVGAAGAIVVGAANSIIAYKKIELQEEIKATVRDMISVAREHYDASKPNDINYFELTLPQRCNFINVASGMHNSIVAKEIDYEVDNTPSPLILKSPAKRDLYETINFNEYTATQISLTELNTAEAQMFSSNYYLSGCDLIDKELNEYIENVQDIDNDEAFASYLFNEEETSKSYVMQILYSYSRSVFSMSDSMDQLIDFSNMFIEKTEQQTTLTNEEKEGIYTYISLLTNSMYYWLNVPQNK